MSSGCPRHGADQIDMGGYCNALIMTAFGADICDWRTPCNSKHARPIRDRYYTTPGKHHALISRSRLSAWPFAQWVFMCTGCTARIVGESRWHVTSCGIAHVEYAEGYR